jgi:hypothetical protein
MATIDHLVIGNSENFKLALGKYAFVPSDYIPREYLECLIKTDISDIDREIILKHLEK